MLMHAATHNVLNRKIAELTFRNREHKTPRNIFKQFTETFTHENKYVYGISVALFYICMSIYGLVGTHGCVLCTISFKVNGAG